MLRQGRHLAALLALVLYALAGGSSAFADPVPNGATWTQD